jgi:hypothetical protein
VKNVTVVAGVVLACLAMASDAQARSSSTKRSEAEAAQLAAVKKAAPARPTAKPSAKPRAAPARKPDTTRERRPGYQFDGTLNAHGAVNPYKLNPNALAGGSSTR